MTKRRHFAHQYMSEVLHDLLAIQKQIHPNLIAIVNGTVAGDGAGPRCMIPRIKDYLIAGYDQVAVDATAAKMMGFDPMRLPFIKLCHDSGLGMGDTDLMPSKNWNFHVKRSLVVWGDQQVRKGKLKFLEPLMHTFLFQLGPVMMSAVYHDLVRYNTIGKKRIKKYNKTKWGKLFQKYPSKVSKDQRLNLIRNE